MFFQKMVIFFVSNLAFITENCHLLRSLSTWTGMPQDQRKRRQHLNEMDGNNWQSNKQSQHANLHENITNRTIIAYLIMFISLEKGR